jgi:hypothetical protein
MVCPLVLITIMGRLDELKITWHWAGLPIK